MTEPRLSKSSQSKKTRLHRKYSRRYYVTLLERDTHRGPGGGRGCKAGITAETPHAQMARTFVDGLAVIVDGDMSAAELQKTANSFK